MSKVDSKSKKEKRSSDKVVVLRKKPKPSPKATYKVPPDIVGKYYPLIDRILPKKFPYTVGIRKDLLAALYKIVPEDRHGELLKSVKVVIAGRVCSVPYQMSLIKGKFRNGINGETEKITKAQRRYALKSLREHYKKEKKERLKKSA